MSASLAEKHFDSFHLSVEFSIYAVSKKLALLVHLVLKLAHFGISSLLQYLDLLELLFKLGDPGFHAGSFHRRISVMWLGCQLDFLVQAGFHRCKVGMCHW